MADLDLREARKSFAVTVQIFNEMADEIEALHAEIADERMFADLHRRQADHLAAKRDRAETIISVWERGEISPALALGKIQATLAVGPLQAEDAV